MPERARGARAPQGAPRHPAAEALRGIRPGGGEPGVRRRDVRRGARLVGCAGRRPRGRGLVSWSGIARRWDLVRVDLEPREGSGQGSARPALVVSNDGFNRHFPLLTVLPLTRTHSKRRPAFGFEVLLPAGAAGNPHESIVMPQQIRTVARARVRARLGSLSDPVLREAVEERLLDHLGSGFEPEE
ncbi:MAG: type II toxin-antitoxin system PemK/MazF family toxin [Gemmatimonadetes bacterium]|nr:type II toxin-antitoxin system PemK/MazF family toxin [Gemmatimonadota bacterium]